MVTYKVTKEWAGNYVVSSSDSARTVTVTKCTVGEGWPFTGWLAQCHENFHTGDPARTKHEAVECAKLMLQCE